MSDPNGPRPAPGSTPAQAPPEPPAGEAARRTVLESHFRSHDGPFTRFALEQAARAAGYSDNDIAAAWSAIDLEDAGRAPAARSAFIARLVILVLYLATFFLFVAGSDLGSRTSGVGTGILAVTMLLVGTVSLLLVGRRKVVSRNLSAAVAGLLAVPFILLVIVAGLCVATTGPSFFGIQPTPGPPPPDKALPSDAPAVAS
jgi:hypothetical protein